MRNWNYFIEIKMMYISGVQKSFCTMLGFDSAFLLTVDILVTFSRSSRVKMTSRSRDNAIFSILLPTLRFNLFQFHDHIAKIGDTTLHFLAKTNDTWQKFPKQIKHSMSTFNRHSKRPIVPSIRGPRRFNRFCVIFKRKKW